jgi:hypothetical protein
MRQALKSPTAAALSILLLLSLAGARDASATLRLSVGNPGLEHFDADGGVQLDFGLTDANGNPVGNLTPSDVKVFEDGKQAKIVDFRGVGQGRPVDIVFVLDVTESMQPYIDAVKQNIISFVQDLASNNRDYRLGLVTFEDYVVSKYPDCNCAYRYSMTSDVHTFISWVSGLHAGGGGDIPEDQLDALAYASTFPFRPEAEGIIILVTDAPPHHDGDGSAYTQHDQAFWDHHKRGEQVTDLTGGKVAAMLKKNGLTMYAVVPPPFIAPQYQEIVDATHGRSYNIVTEQGRFASLVREIGHSIATEYSLTYRTPRPIEDGTTRQVELQVTYNGDSATTSTSYQVRGVGGAAINVPEEGAAPGEQPTGTGLAQLSFRWWNGAVPLAAILLLLGLSRLRFGVSSEELKAIVEAQSRAAPPSPIQAVRQAAQGFQASRTAPPSARTAQEAAAGGGYGGPRLQTLNPVGPIASEYAILKDEISVGRGEDNDIVIPHASVSRAHARLVRRDGGYELMDLNSTNGSFVNGQQVRGTAMVASGEQLRLGDIQFVLRF